MIDFSLAVEKWVAKAKGQGEAAFRAIASDALAKVKELTPVKTGYLRANWTAIRNNDPVPIPAHVQEPEKTLADLRLGDKVVIVNPVVYARRVEYGFVGKDSLGRFYDQKGAGMMTRTMEQLPQIARRAVERVREGGS